MPRRIEIELTSTKVDGSWTWRAAGARQPKGDLEASLLPENTKVGDLLRADVDTGLEGTVVLAVLPPKGARSEPDRIELHSSADPDEWVTTTLARRGRGDRGDSGGGRGSRPDRDQRRSGGPGATRDRSEAKRGGPGRTGSSRGGDQRAKDGDRRPGARPEGGRGGPQREHKRTDSRPRPKRLRAGRDHRRAVIDELPVEHRPIAEQVLKGGIPAVRVAVEKQNEQARAEGQPEIKPEQLVDLAEQLLPRLRTAEWRDRADAALADIEEVDLRDLRSVIVAADSATKDDDTRTTAASLRDGLARRVELEQASWLADMAASLADGRIVRALSLSSRPPKAGVPLPPDLAERLLTAATAALTADTPSSRWATVVDAVSFSPIHLKVIPESIPAEPDEGLLTAVRMASSRVPQIAAVFGIAPTAPPPERRRGQRPAGKGPAGKRPAGKGRGDKAKADPNKADPNKADPNKADPSKADPAKAEPNKAEPNKAEPNKAEPNKAEPNKAEPNKANTASQPPADSGPPPQPHEEATPNAVPPAVPPASSTEDTSTTAPPLGNQPDATGELTGTAQSRETESSGPPAES